jgi:hypothetical protein
MAIQGVIKGFADPAEGHEANLLLIGQGASYHVLCAGVLVHSTEDLEEAFGLFDDRAEPLCQQHWLEVREVALPSVGGVSVLSVGNRTYAQYLSDLKALERPRG